MSLIVKKSQLSGACMGLFTNKPIKKGKKIIQYRGEHISKNEFKKREKSKYTKCEYVFLVDNNLYIDSENTPQYKARYANDASGPSKIKGVKNNSFFEVYNKTPYIVASRDIKTGEEIFVSYTPSYWKYIKKQTKKCSIKK
jgi:hypothetical protein